MRSGRKLNAIDRVARPDPGLLADVVGAMNSSVSSRSYAARARRLAAVGVVLARAVHEQVVAPSATRSQRLSRSIAK